MEILKKKGIQLPKSWQSLVYDDIGSEMKKLGFRPPAQAF